MPNENKAGGERAGADQKVPQITPNTVRATSVRPEGVVKTVDGRKVKQTTVGDTTINEYVK